MNREKVESLELALRLVPQADYSVQSRVHPLRSFSGAFVKRDDELGFGVTGSKLRKFRTVIPYLLQLNMETAIVIGGAYSNNVVGLSQLLIENGIMPILFLRGEASASLQGTHLMMRLLVPESNIRWVSRKEWPQVGSLAEEYACGLKNAIVISEGCILPAALPGAMTLALDILRNEEQHGVIFDRIFVDAGTGMTAAALLLAYAWMEKKTKITVVSLADEMDAFQKMLERCHGYFETWLQQSVQVPTEYNFIRPLTAKAYGSTNHAMMQAISSLAKAEGFLTDPIYSAKLFYTAKSVLSSSREKSLLIHSGGGLALSGYQYDLSKVI